MSDMPKELRVHNPTMDYCYDAEDRVRIEPDEEIKYVRADLYEAVQNKLKRYEGLLDELEDYFDQRQDVDCDQDGYIPNDEMRMLQLIQKERSK